MLAQAHWSWNLDTHTHTLVGSPTDKQANQSSLFPEGSWESFSCSCGEDLQAL